MMKTQLMAVVLGAVLSSGVVYAQGRPSLPSLAERQCAALRDNAEQEQRYADQKARWEGREWCEAGARICVETCLTTQEGAHRGQCDPNGTGQDACTGCFRDCRQRGSNCRKAASIKASARVVSALTFTKRCGSLERSGCPLKKIGMVDEVKACGVAMTILRDAPPMLGGDGPLFLE